MLCAMKLQTKFLLTCGLIALFICTSLAYVVRIDIHRIWLEQHSYWTVQSLPAETIHHDDRSGNWNRMEHRLSWHIASFIFFFGALGFGGAVFFIQKLFSPIRQLTAAAAQVHENTPLAGVPAASQDELSRLAGTFNQMSRSLAETTVYKNYMSRILSNLVDPLIVMGPDTTIRMINPAVSQSLGYSETELVGQPLSLLCPEDENRLILAEQGNRLRQGSVHNLEVSMQAKCGQRVPVLFSSSVMKEANQDVSAIIVVAKDMTERKKLERQLLQTGKLAAVGQLAGGVAHEINNPLSVILGFAQTMLSLMEPGHAHEKPLRSIERETLRCKELVQGLLTFSRAAKVDRETMNLNDAVEGALSLVTAQARIGHVEIKKELMDSLPPMFGNPNQVQQVIINLANNALDAMGLQGTLTVRTDWVKTETSSWACLYVTDTGNGIPREILTHLFEPFLTTKPLGKGTGLGLSLVHQIVQKHAGTIDVTSRPGHTQFCVKFPIRVLAASLQK
jgi:PAS domain S-box-containing protein